MTKYNNLLYANLKIAMRSFWLSVPDLWNFKLFLHLFLVIQYFNFIQHSLYISATFLLKIAYTEFRNNSFQFLYWLSLKFQLKVPCSNVLLENYRTSAIVLLIFDIIVLVGFNKSIKRSSSTSAIVKRFIKITYIFCFCSNKCYTAHAVQYICLQYI